MPLSASVPGQNVLSSSWEKFFWPGLKIPKAGGLASSAGNLFQGFASLSDKKLFLVCNSLHSWNSDPDATKEDGFSDTIWAFVWTGLEIWDLWKGWIFQSESKVNWFIPVLFLLYVPQTLFPSWGTHSPFKNMKGTTWGHTNAPSSIYPLQTSGNTQHIKTYKIKISTYWCFPQGFIFH